MLTQTNIPYVRNNDQVIGFMSSKQVKSIQGYQDLASMYSWYEEDPLKNHLGLMNFWGKQSNVSFPIYKELLENKAILEVNGLNGTFTYDIPIEEEKGCYTEVDWSSQTNAGIDGTPFKVNLSKEFTKGDILTYDAEFGEQFIVDDSEPVRQVGTGYEHVVKLVSNNKAAKFPYAKLAKGIQYFKISHGTNEYGLEFSHVEMPDTVGSMTCEFTLGNWRGAEAYVTAAADKKKFSGAAISSKQYIDKLTSEANELGELMFITNMGKGGMPDMKNARIGSTMEYLVMRELEKMTAHSLLFQRAGIIRDANGVIRLNEGLWHQLRRGKVINYGRPGGITRSHIKEAAEYVFRINPHINYEDRRLTFKAGKRAFYNILEIFKNEVEAQLNRLSSLMGTDRQLPTNPVSGSNMNLKLSPVRFTDVFIPEIGQVSIEHDPSLDQMPLADRFSSGFHGNGFAHTTYSMVIWDVSDQMYSNNKQLPKGAKLVENGDEKANIYLVKPEGEMTYWGTSNGRYNIRKATDIVSNFKAMGQEFWAWNASAIWVKDVSKFVMIELDQSARAGYTT